MRTAVSRSGSPEIPFVGFVAINQEPSIILGGIFKITEIWNRGGIGKQSGERDYVGPWTEFGAAVCSYIHVVGGVAGEVVNSVGTGGRDVRGDGVRINIYKQNLAEYEINTKLTPKTRYRKRFFKWQTN